MNTESMRRRQPDDYLQNARSHCAAMAPGIFRKCCKNCAILPNPLRFNGFSFDGLRTPTLKVAGSNPVGRTKRGG